MGNENSRQESVYGATEKVYMWYQLKKKMKARVMEQFRHEKRDLVNKRRDKFVQGSNVALRCDADKVKKKLTRMLP